MISGDGIGATELYFVWLAIFVVTCVLSLSGLWCWVCRSGRVSNATWTIWTLATLAPVACCCCDAGQRLDAALPRSIARVTKAILLALVLAGPAWFALRRPYAAGGPDATGPDSAPLARRLSWQLIVVNGVAAVWTAACFYQAVAPEPDGIPTLPPVMQWATTDGAQGLTDRGNSLVLLVPENPQDFQRIPLSALFGDRFNERLIEVEAPDKRSDCHGWIFTGGSFGMVGEALRMVLLDNDYVQVQQPRPGDLVVYREPDGTVAHAGIVRLVEDDLVLVESKWGSQARYVHRLLDQPYATVYEFYRSPRKGHLINLAPAKAGL